MGTPQAVQDQVDEANRIQKELSGESKTETGDIQQTNNQQIDKQSEPAKKTEKLVKPGESGESIEQLKAQLEQINTRFNSYKKLYDKEVSNSRVELQKKNDEITQLRTDIEKLNESSKEQQQQQEESETNEVLDGISKEFGPEFVDAVSNLSKKQLITQNASLLARIDNIEKRLPEKSNEQSIVHETVDESEDTNGNDFVSKLSVLVSDWEQINDLPQFKTWLDGADTNGRRRQDNLVDAHKKGDVKTVSDLFFSFKDQAQNSRRESTGDYLPDGSNSGEQETHVDVVTQQDISDFYRDKALGKYTPEEAAKREAKINAAMESGTIR